MFHLLIARQVRYFGKDNSILSHIHTINSIVFASSSPTVDQDFIFVSWTTKKSNDLICLDHSGKIIWRRDFGIFQTQHGNGFSPIVHKEYVFVTHDHESDSALFALNRKTGKILWKLDRIGSKPSSSTPTIYETNNGKTYVVSSSQSHGCYAVDIETGKILWETGQGTLDKRSVFFPLFLGRLFFLHPVVRAGRGNRFLIIQPPKNQDDKVSIKYTITRNAPYVPTSLVINNFVFALTDAGIASAIDLSNGELLWKERLDGNFFCLSSNLRRHNLCAFD